MRLPRRMQFQRLSPHAVPGKHFSLDLPERRWPYTRRLSDLTFFCAWYIIVLVSEAFVFGLSASGAMRYCGVHNSDVGLTLALGELPDIVESPSNMCWLLRTVHPPCFSLWLLSSCWHISCFLCLVVLHWFAAAQARDSGECGGVAMRSPSTRESGSQSIPRIPLCPSL